MSDDLKSAVRRSGSWWQTVGTVAWGFFGVRRGADWARDLQKVNPVHLIIAALVGAGLFITVLVLLVRWVVGSGVATG